jgi:thioester reductase-like protein
MKIFMTGITGLVGSAFVTHMLRSRKDITIVAIARGNNARTAQQRVDEILREQCEFDNHPQDADMIIGAVTVIEGDVATLDIDKLSALPILQNTDSTFHCAADVNLGKDPEGKTFNINYNGTKNMLAISNKLGVKEFHYVSTAYVAGKLHGRAMEDTPINSGFNNPYEESKFKAESLVRASGMKFTIYRPAIIVGRSTDGQVRKPLAFYRILEFMAKLKKHHCAKENLNPVDWVDLSLSFDAVAGSMVYFVPIDYVQLVTCALFQMPVCNKTYHLTTDCPVKTNDINRAICETIKIHGVTVEHCPHELNVDEKLLSRLLRDLLPYFSVEIVFDQTNVDAALGADKPVIEFDFEWLKMLMASYLLEFFPKVDWLHDLLELPAPDDN